jgi:flagellar hook-associated protein 3
MRITNNLLIHNMLWNMNNNLVSMNDKQTQLSTGKAINKASDDPVGTTRIIKVKSDIVENEQYSDNVRDAQSWLDVSENSLMDTKEIIQRVRELAVQGANGTYTAGETDKIAKEIDQLIDEIIVNANSTLAGRYLFSGFQTDSPLLNKDGTYNIDITSEKVTDFESIAYEVAVGEHLTVGTDYLQAFGMVPNDQTLIDAFLFKNDDGEVQQTAEATGQAATHSKAQFTFNYKADLTTATTEVVVDGVTYTLEASKLKGNISQEEFLDILSNAEQTSPAPTTPTPVLGSAAEVYFVASDDTANTLGELVIESKAFGPQIIDISGMGPVSYEGKSPLVTSGVAGVEPVNAKIEGYFDYGTKLEEETLQFVINGVTYSVDTEDFDGELTEEDFVELIDTAKDREGNLLREVANVTFKATADTRGVLTIEGKADVTGTTIVKDNGSGFAVFPKITAGSDSGLAKKPRLTGTIDITTNLSANPSGDLSFTFGDKTYVVDTSTMNGGLPIESIKSLLENASDGSGGRLGDIAKITVSSNSNPYSIEISAYDAAEYTPSSNDVGGLFTATPTVYEGEAYQEGDPGKKAKIQGPIDLTKDISASATGDLSFTLNGVTYSVDTSTMDGSRTAAEVKALIENASDGSSGKLGDVAIVSFDNSENPYELSIESKENLYDMPKSNDVSGLFVHGITTVNGVAKTESIPSTVEGALDLTKDISGQELSYTIGGVTYTVNTSTMTGSLTSSAVKTLIESASGGGGQLSDVATVTVNSTLNPYDFTIEAKVGADDTISVVDEGKIYVESPFTIGSKTVEPVKAKIEGVFDYSTNLTASTLSFEIGGETYNVDTSAMDGSLSEEDFLELIKSAEDSSGNKLSDVMLVSFAPTTGSQGTLTLEQKTGGDAVVNVTDPGSGFTVAPTETDGVDGIIHTKAIVTGTASITDAMLADPDKGVGQQSFVVTYNGETKRIDVDLTEVNSLVEMRQAVNQELNYAFGDDGGTPAINNVTFDIAFDGSKDVIQFTGAAKDDGSSVSLKVDVIVSSKSQMVQDLEDFSKALSDKNDDGINDFLGQIDDHLDNILTVLADIGAKSNRLDFIENRIDDNTIAMTEILTKVQDIDYAEITIKFKSLESIYRASLSVGAKVIQPTLVDFIQ